MTTQEITKTEFETEFEETNHGPHVRYRPYDNGIVVVSWVESGGVYFSQAFEGYNCQAEALNFARSIEEPDWSTVV